MPSIFDEEEEVAEKQSRYKPSARRDDDEDDYATPREDDREVTLSSTTLLLIFFGLVLVCALFFGLGYTLGRRSHAEPAVLPTSTTLPASTTSDSSLTSSGQPKPSAAAQPAARQSDQLSATEPETADTQPESQPEAVAPRPTPKPAITPTPQAAETPHPVKEVKAALPTTTGATATPQPPATAGTMVQVAAISNPADADVLVRALQKHGYSVSVHHAATDTLLHVQVGPFANRPDAIAMRQKLLADGYNAILK
jgi:DedD protein